jgi:hypothetical protein
MMLVFGDNQQKEFDAAARQREAARLMPIMRRNFPEKTAALNDDALGISIFTALEHANQWSITTRTACINFVIMWILLGEYFDRTPEIRKYLELPNMEGSSKINALMNELKWKLNQAQ